VRAHAVVVSWLVLYQYWQPRTDNRNTLRRLCFVMDFQASMLLHLSLKYSWEHTKESDSHIEFGYELLIARAQNLKK
jgi:hypothetical protein